MLRRVFLVRTDVSEELSLSFSMVTRIVELRTILVALLKETLNFAETSVLTRATRRNIPDDAILLSHRSENLKSYVSINLSFTPFARFSLHQSSQVPLILD
jgi:hypothetical protein